MGKRVRYYGKGSDRDQAKVRDIQSRDEQARKDSDSLRDRAASAYEQAQQAKQRVADPAKRKVLYENAKKRGIFKGTFEEFNKFLNDQGVK